MEKIDEVMFASNGRTSVIRGNKLVNDLQEEWSKLFVKFLKSKGINVDENVKFLFPNGRTAKYLPEYESFMFQ